MYSLQERLSQASIALITGMALSDYLLAFCLAMGVGRLTIIEAEPRHKGWLDAVSPSFKTKSSAELASSIWPKARIEGFKVADELTLGGSNVILDAGGCMRDADFLNLIPDDSLYLDVWVSGSIGMLGCHRNEPTLSYERLLSRKLGRIDTIPSLPLPFETPSVGLEAIIAGMAAEELRKHICPLPADIPLKGRLLLDTRSKKITETLPQKIGSIDFEKPPNGIEGRRVAVVGAGGTGTTALLAICSAFPTEVIIFDNDIVEGSNLKRQYLFRASDLGKPKAGVIAERLQAAFPSVKTVAKNDRIYLENGRALLEGYDCIFSCVDNELARKNLSQIAAEARIPLFDCGVGNGYARAEGFIPGYNYCPNCMHDYRAVENEGRSCSRGSVQEPDMLNTVIPNAIAGGLLALLASCLFTEPLYSAVYSPSTHLTNERISFGKVFTRHRAKPLQCPCRGYYHGN